MHVYVLRRLLQTIPVLFLASIIVFVVIRLTPGDAAELQLGIRGANDTTSLAALRHAMGLDRPIIVQYGIWLGHILQGNLGVSVRSGVAVTTLLGEKAPATIELVVAAVLFGLCLAIPLGTASAVNRHGLLAILGRTLALFGLAIPVYWLGLLLLLLFAVTLGWLPVSGYVPFSVDPVGNLKHLVLPMVSVGVFEMALFTRFLRAEMLQVLQQDYIRTARAKGLLRRSILLKHGLRNGLVPLITIVGLELGTLVGGVVIVEQVFGWSGLGWLALQAINDKDYPVLQGVILVFALGVAMANLLADVTVACADPRIRAGAR
jgi:peptide/nickel transport system permease protein